MTERLPHPAPRSNAKPVDTYSQLRRVCCKCNRHKPMKGGSTTNRGKTWICADCKGGSNEPGAIPVHRHAPSPKVGP
jgi:hypothetical protein